RRDPRARRRRRHGRRRARRSLLMRAAAMPALAAAALAACADVPPFRCDTDDQCGAGGRCEEDRACSFLDDTCHTERRYGAEGPPAVAGTCVGESSGAIAWLAAGSDFACGRAADDGRLWCWGDNTSGGLGRDDVGKSGTPTPIAGLADVVDADGGEFTSCAVAGGNVLCWGRGSGGQLGDDSMADRARPGPVLDVAGAVAVQLGEHHGCALDDAGAVWCWGSNAEGETGEPGQ